MLRNNQVFNSKLAYKILKIVLNQKQRKESVSNHGAHTLDS